MINIDEVKGQLAKISNDVINDLKEMVKIMTSNIELYGEIDHVLFHEWDINAPIHTDSSDGNLTETISGMYIQDDTDELIFTIDTYDSGYDVKSDDIIIDNLIYIHQNLIDAVDDYVAPITPEEFEQFFNEWGQSHEEICSCLGYDEDTSDDLLVDDYFWVTSKELWCNKGASGMNDRDKEIADYLRNN